MRRGYSRDYEQALLGKILECSDCQLLLDYLLQWLSSDDTCKALEDFCNDYNIDYDYL